MFPNGWPGRGLLILRVSAGVLVLHQALSLIPDSTHPSSITLVASAIAGILLLLGIWTPAAGMLLAALEILKLCCKMEQPEGAILTAAVGLSIAMLGPGAWSVDAALFGRHRLEFPKD
jgi:uncharacterized membrane protein YphA (DoxX/SURF4 family)